MQVRRKCSNEVQKDSDEYRVLTWLVVKKVEDYLKWSQARAMKGHENRVYQDDSKISDRKTFGHLKL